MNDKIEILFIGDNNLRLVGGAEESTKIIVNGLKDTFKIGLINPGEISVIIKDTKQFNVTTIERIKKLIKRPIELMRYMRKISALIKRSNPKIIHTQGQASFLILGILLDLRFIKKEFVIIHTDRGVFDAYSALLKKMFIHFMGHVDTLVTTTIFNRNQWAGHINSDINQIVIPNTAGDNFEKTVHSKKLLPLNEMDKTITIGFAGRYIKKKDWNLAAKIIKETRKKIGEKLRVKMAIGCLDEQSKVEAKIYIDELRGILGSSLDAEINVNPTKMNEFYQDIDVYILTSKPNTESFGRTIIEAMSKYTAVLSTDAGGPVEVINNEDNILFEPKEFAEKIQNFSINKKSLLDEKKANFEHVTSNYSLEKNIKLHYDLYTNMMGLR